MEDSSKINITPDNIDKYYDKINKLIDEYFSWKIKPSALKKYFKSGGIAIKKFIDRNNLSNIINIHKIILDVIEDRYAMEKDGVLTFENYETILENVLTSNDETALSYILYNNLNLTDIKEEKVVADYYRTSLGHVVEVDKKSHEYTVNTLNNNYDVTIFSEDDLNIIGMNLVDYLEEYLNNKSIFVAPLNININIGSITNKDGIKSIIDSKDYIIKIISEILNTHEYKYQKKFGNYYFWQR